MSIEDLSIAGARDEVYLAVPRRFAGDGDINTAPDVIGLFATVIPAMTPLTRDATSGALKPVAALTDKIEGITVYAVDATAAAVTKSVYVGGYFNTLAVIWPSAFTTDAQKDAARTDKFLFRPVGVASDTGQ